MLLHPRITCGTAVHPFSQERARADWLAWRQAAHRETDELRASLARLEQRATVQDALLTHVHATPATRATVMGTTTTTTSLAASNAAPSSPSAAGHYQNAQIAQLRAEFATLRTRMHEDEVCVRCIYMIQHSSSACCQNYVICLYHFS